MKESVGNKANIEGNYHNEDMADSAERYQLRLMATTDLHVALTGYDYYRNTDTGEMGLSHTAMLIHQAREEVANHLLLDNGDIIQGNPIGDYAASSLFWQHPASQQEEQQVTDALFAASSDTDTNRNSTGVHPMIELMNLLQYDAATVGNHEFNYGLDYLEQCLNEAQFPYTNANVYRISDEQPDAPLLQPYLILPRELKGASGESAILNIGIIGLVPTQILNWDKGHLEGHVRVQDMVETTEAMVPRLQAAGADIIVLLAHTGYIEENDPSISENAVLPLSQINGVDALIFGHAHKLYPSEEFAGRPGVNLEKGTIHDVPAVEPGVWGSHLGIIDLELQHTAGKWSVVEGHGMLRSVVADLTDAGADRLLQEAAQTAHERTLAYIRTPVGYTSEPLYSYFALIMDNPVVQIINDAQLWYTRTMLMNTEYADIPLLSAASAFKTGGRYGSDHYTDISPGELTLQHISDIYSYANTLCAVRLNGDELKEWLEWSAGLFNTIDLHGAAEQELINPTFSPFNFDVIDGISYRIDISCPARYDASGQLVQPDHHRIRYLCYQGVPVTDDMEFIIVTNQYRAYTTILANPDGERIVIDAPIENRDVVTAYVRQHETIAPQADDNWCITLGTQEQYLSHSTNVQLEDQVQETRPDSSIIAVFSSAAAAEVWVDQYPQLSVIVSEAGGFTRYGIRLEV
ncbi:bifunctional 2',3'-cyclic-nucleotide 2'-phosphodiesterase/3'-nucleotidase [Paenibacillus dauci]|uniref:bifunctional 2',3'-cyclic-nucleotide 2'-phosphodiesterase/3'-nucleotidase n=1 Tax=Paenibacillus dauci TaxID=1567106 RepID=UPI000696FEA0|nr:bifunctional 2',3'-cyclic-nucleotide 2'-phosphodiesterase/3'-nucleotidase [Paenibacillus dauci]